jgi:hypothetical protein
LNSIELTFPGHRKIKFIPKPDPSHVREEFSPHSNYYSGTKLNLFSGCGSHRFLLTQG